MPYIVPDKVKEPLYAIVPYFNPWRWKSREKHTLRAIKHFAESGAVVILVEAAFNRRTLSLVDCGLDGKLAECGMHDKEFRHQYIGLRTDEELWLKENLINLAVSRLPYDWQQVCWLDSDVHFLRPNWVGECIHKLQHYSFLQMFSHARDLGPNYEMLPESYPHSNGIAFVRSWMDGTLFNDLGPAHWTPQIRADIERVKGDLQKLRTDVQTLEQDIDYYGMGVAGRRLFPGLAWACTRKAWDDVGGLIDFAIWGGGDWHMAHALVNSTAAMMLPTLHPNYKAKVSAWHQNAERLVRRNVGVMEGSIVHHWHGRKTERGYGAKHSLLAKIGFDPIAHLKRDSQGVFQLHDDGSDSFIQLRDTMRRIAKERNEDSIDQ